MRSRVYKFVSYQILPSAYTKVKLSAYTNRGGQDCGGSEINGGNEIQKFKMETKLKNFENVFEISKMCFYFMKFIDF